MTASLVFALTIGSFCVAALIGLLGDALRQGRVASGLAALLLAAGGAVSLYFAWTSEPQLAYDTFVGGGGFSAVVGLVGILAAASLACDDGGSPARSGQRAALVSFSAAGAGIAAQATDLITLALALEIAAAGGYALVAGARTRRSAEAAMKYFVQGATATALLVVAIAVLVGTYAPDGGYGQLRTAVDSGAEGPLLLGLLLVVTVLVFKAGGAPFHSWAPDAYQTAPPASSAFLAGALKLSAVTALVTIVATVAPPGTGAGMLGTLGADIFPILGGLAVTSIVVGSLVALRQRSYTRMLAYAGVAQVGYALIALASVSPGDAVFFTASYALATTGAFAAASAFRSALPQWDGTIEGLAGVGRRHPLLGLSVTFLFLSLAGIPPLLGFLGKLQAFQSAIALAIALSVQGASGLAMWYAVLAATGIAGAVVSLAYYGSVLRALYAPENAHPEKARSGSATIVVAGLALTVLLAGAMPLALPLADLLRGFAL